MLARVYAETLETPQGLQAPRSGYVKPRHHTPIGCSVSTLVWQSTSTALQGVCSFPAMSSEETELSCFPAE